MTTLWDNYYKGTVDTGHHDQPSFMLYRNTYMSRWTIL